MGKGRLEAFSDGVFAIAATLLILHVTADAPGGELAAALRHAWPQYAAYVLSFLMIGTWWVNHHSYVVVIDRVDRTFLFGNLGFLACVAFLPFPTPLVAEHFRDGGLRAAAVLYGITLTAAAACILVVWRRAATGRRLISATADQRVVDRHTRDISFGAPSCAVATLIALWSAYATLAIISAALILYIFGVTILERRHDGARSAPTAAL